MMLLISAFSGVRANHLIGTDWQLAPLSGNQVRVRLTLYTDPVDGGVNAPGDPTVTVGAYERTVGPGGNDRLIATFTLPRTASRVLPGATPGCSQLGIAILEVVYEAVVAFDGGFTSASGYYLAWERCCRNQRLTNVSAGQTAPLAATVQFPARPPAGQGLPNQTARFGPPPPAVAL